MTESELLEIFRRALRASLAVPLLAGMTSCSSSSGPSTPDAAKAADTGVKADSGHDSGAKPKKVDAGRDAAAPDAGVTPDSAKGDARVDTGVGHDAGLDANHPVDSGKVDAHRVDAGVDSGHPEDSGKADAPRVDAGRDAAAEDAPNPCSFPEAGCIVVVPLFCFDGGIRADSQPTQAQCNAACPTAPPSTCSILDGFDAGLGYSMPVSLDCSTQNYCNGRAYAGMARPTAPGQRSPLGRYFAQSAELEAASIDAFRILRDELRAHGAPEALVDGAEAAARDEVRHARVTRKLARRYGPVAPHRRIAARPVRPLDVVAEENAVEGCVRETYAALLAHHQAAAARDPEVVAAMTEIAVDETRHAALAWKVAAWAGSRLDEEARSRVRAARATAVRELLDEMARKVPQPLTDVAGLPAADAAMRMLAVLDAELWNSEG